MDGTVLVADDDRTIRTVLTQALTRAGCRVHATGSLVTLKHWVEEGRGDLVISDVVMPDGNGLKALPEIARLRPNLPVIVISAQNTIMTAIQAAEAEAFDYLPKPFDLPDLMKRVSTGLKATRQRKLPQHETLDEPADQDLPLVGHSPEMQDLYRLVARVMNTDLPVLITGASGTGKSLIARALHDYSDRREWPFVIAGAHDLETPEGAKALISKAGQGTLLFDEVSDLDVYAQARLTRLLDRLGKSAPRIITTSQKDLSDEEFREDLFFRLAGVTIPVPPLQNRLEDIPELAAHFLTAAAHEGQPRRQLSSDAVKCLRTYSWPGNIRQLENTMHQLSVTATETEITVGEIEAVLGSLQDTARQMHYGSDGLSAAVAHHINRYFDLHGQALPPAGLYGRILPEIERPLIEIALDATGGNQAKCADLLGLNRNTLRKKLTMLGIEVTRRRRLM